MIRMTTIRGVEDFLLEMKESIRALRSEVPGRAADYWSRIGEFYQNPKARASTDSLLLLAAMFSLDHLIQHPIGLRMMYILPIWLAAKRGGRLAGYLVVAATTLAITLIDLGAKNLDPNELIANSAMMLAVLIALMTFIEHFESNLRKYATMARRDSLTGALNRMGLDEYMERVVDRALGTGTPLTVAMIDCDRFKALNDAHGHAYGDHVLRTLARLLRRYSPSGMVARNGGDEFVLVLPGKHPCDARAILDKVDWKLREATVLGDQCASITFGLSRIGADGTTTHELLSAADRDMYRNKNKHHQFAVIEPRAAISIPA
jgi:diguanylate cyclase (GGDEF)-like protein